MRIARWLGAPLLVSASLFVLSGCGHGRAVHALPPTANGATAGGPAAGHRKPRTINEAAYPNAVLTDHPIAFYRLDDTGSSMVDASGNALTGTYGSAVTRGAGSLVPNTIDPAASFPGGAWSANSIATVPHNTTLQPSSLTIEAWINEQAANSSGWIDLVSYGPQSGGQAYSLQISPTNTLSGYVANSSSSGSSQYVGTIVLTPGSSYHVVMVYDGTTPKVYINGKLDTGGTTYGSSGAISYAGVGTTYGLSIGAGQSSSRNVFKGSIDDVSLFSSALTATQVTTHYTAGTFFPDDAYADTVMTDTPVSYYRLDDAGTTMYDATNHRNNGSYGSSVTKRVTGLISNVSDTAAGFPGGAWSANSIAKVAQSSLLQPTAVSVEAWVKETATNSGGTIDLVSYGQQSAEPYALQITSGNALSFVVSTSTPATLTATSSTAMTAGTVYHVVGTFDGSNAKLYINGTQSASTNGSGNVSYTGISTYGLAIGATQSTTRNVFNGTLDEVAVYDHALSASSVLAHYNTSTWTSNQSGPPHILTWAYFDESHNYAVSMQYMVRHVDWVENLGNFSYSDSFRASGGMHATTYTDPGYIYYCNSPFGPTSQNTPGSCALPSGPLGDPTLSSDESAWLHAVSAVGSGYQVCYASNAGARLHFWDGGACNDGSQYLYGEALYPGSSHVQTAYASETSSFTSSHTLDAIFMDDSGPHYNSNNWYYTGASPNEYESLGSSKGATYNRDVIALACKASRPVFFNGPSWDPLDATNGSAEKADDTAMLSSPCVAGSILEGSFTGGFRKSLNEHAEWNTFIPAADRALLAESLGKYAVMLDYTGCNYGDSSCTFDPTGDRIYALGGIWLVYDPRYSIAWNGVTASDGDPNMIDYDGNWDSMVSEFTIVPTQPVQTATSSNITTLQISDGHTLSGAPNGGVFRREFAQCYQDGASIGHCAVVLNAESAQYTSGGVAPMPTLTYTYSKSLSLTDAPADAGGAVSWSSTIPTSLQPKTAVILAQ